MLTTKLWLSCCRLSGDMACLFAGRSSYPRAQKFIASGIMTSALRFISLQAEFSLDAIVKNDVFMDSERGLIFIVTGPNQEGRRRIFAVGLVQLLAQAVFWYLRKRCDQAC